MNGIACPPNRSGSAALESAVLSSQTAGRAVSLPAKVSSDLQLAQEVMADLYRFHDRLVEILLLHEEVFDLRLIERTEQTFPVDLAAAYFGRVGFDFIDPGFGAGFD